MKSVAMILPVLVVIQGCGGRPTGGWTREAQDCRSDYSYIYGDGILANREAKAWISECIREERERRQNAWDVCERKYYDIHTEPSSVRERKVWINECVREGQRPNARTQ